jgi:DNA processing protein
LWVHGRTPGAVEAEQSLAVVGSRAASRAACARVNELAADLARAGFAIISGGALGIDAAAHRGALAARGATFAVLGCGIDVVYPDRHADLFRQIALRGGLLSEYGPGISPRPGQFPARNRLVAALAGAVIIAESRAGSGALITARLASALGRPLLAVPGSAGTDGLLAAGAAVSVESAADVLDALAGKSRPSPLIPAKFRDIIAALGDGPASADVIARLSGRPLGEVLGVLFEAELSGLVVRVPGGRFEVPRGH